MKLDCNPFGYVTVARLLAGSYVYRVVFAPPDICRLLSTTVASRFMLEFLKRQPLTAFVLYRVVAAAAVFVVLLSPHGA